MISATVITYNGERHIVNCLRSLRWVDEIVVVDSFSTDRTVELARQYTDKVHQNPWPGFSAQKNFAAAETSGDWILHLDVDEQVTDLLAQEIREVIASAGSLDAYYIPRYNFWLGKWIKHGGWYPDYVLRLHRRGMAQYEGLTHEQMICLGKAGRLKNGLLHYSYYSIQEHVERMILRSAGLEVKEAIEKGVQIYPVFPWRPVANFIFQFLKGPKTGLAFRLLYKDLLKNRVEVAWLIPFMPFMRFFYMYMFRLGFLDGIPGFWIAMLSAFYEAVRYGKLWEHYFKQGRKGVIGIDQREVWEQSSTRV